MTGFKRGDKVWWVCEEMGGVHLHPVAVVDPTEGLRAKVHLREGDMYYVPKRELYRARAEAIQALMELDGFKLRDGWE